MSGCVYFVRGGKGGTRIKIGFTTDLGQRLLTLQTGSAEKLELRAVIHSCEMSLERDLHEFFKPLRRQGEWFDPNGGLLQFIQLIRGGAQPKSRIDIENFYYFAIHPSRRDAARRIIADPKSPKDELRDAHILIRHIGQAQKLHFEH